MKLSMLSAGERIVAKHVLDVRVDGQSVMYRGVVFVDTDTGVVTVLKDENGNFQRNSWGDFTDYSLRGVVEVDFPEGVSWPR